MNAVDRIGHVAVGDLVAFTPSKRAPLFRVDRISDRWIHCTAVDDHTRTRSVPVASYRALVSVAHDDPRRLPEVD